MRFAPGRPVLHRHFHRDRLAFVRQAWAVDDGDSGLRLWTPRGAPMLSLAAGDGRGMRAMPFREWVRQPARLVASRWDRGFHYLQLIRPGVAHAVWWMFDDHGTFLSWYVNLEDPGVRWDDGHAAGVDTVDHDLDIVVGPDRSWRWKDEDELTERLAFPEHYWVRDPHAVRAEGERVIALIEAGAFPFDGSWCDFRPAPSWDGAADLLPGWDRPRAG
jgi:predicted RNA-binding protein associated with RNAse of E/G family